MLYTPVPGTPLYFEMAEQGRLLDVDLADIHGQHAFNFEHAAISREQSTRSLAWAFQRDFERNGPSLFRICRTTFTGYMRYKNHPDRRIRERWRRECRTLRHAWVGFLWAMEHRLNTSNPAVAAKIRTLRKQMEQEFGLVADRRGQTARPGPVVDQPPRRETSRRRPVLRARHHHRPPQLGRGTVACPSLPAPSIQARRLAPDLITLETGESPSGD